MKPTPLFNLLILVGIILIASGTHAQATTLQPYTQPFAYVTHLPLAGLELSVVNLETQKVTPINSNNGASFKTALVDPRGNRAYLIFQNTAGLFIESWNLVSNKKILETTNLLSNGSDFQFFLADKGKKIVIVGKDNFSGGWWVYWLDTTTLNVIGLKQATGTGAFARATISVDEKKVYTVIGFPTSTTTEVNLLTGTSKSVNALLNNPADIISIPAGPITTHVIGNSSQIQKFDFTGITPTVQTTTTAVAGPPQINTNPSGTKIMFLPNNQDYKGGFLENFTFKCSFNTTNLIWKPFFDIGDKGFAYGIIDQNMPGGTSKLYRHNTDNCTSTPLMNATSGTYSKNRSAISLTEDENYLVTVESNNLHIFDLTTLTESVINVGPATQVTTRTNVKVPSKP